MTACFTGQGTMTFTNGAKYVGEFIGGYMHGQGKMVFPSATSKRACGTLTKKTTRNASMTIRVLENECASRDYIILYKALLYYIKLYNTIFKEGGLCCVKPKELMRILAQDGWVVVRIQGSHHIHKHSTKPGTIAVAFHNKDMALGTLNKILKAAGLK